MLGYTYEQTLSSFIWTSWVLSSIKLDEETTELYTEELVDQLDWLLSVSDWN